MKVGFGIQLPTWAAFPYEEVVEQAVLAEKAGFDYICVPDHFFETERQYPMFKATYERCDPTRMNHFEAFRSQPVPPSRQRQGILQNLRGEDYPTLQ